MAASYAERPTLRRWRRTPSGPIQYRYYATSRDAAETVASTNWPLGATLSGATGSHVPKVIGTRMMEMRPSQPGSVLIEVAYAQPQSYDSTASDLSAYEIQERVEGKRRNRFRGRRVFCIPDDQIETLRSQFDVGNLWPDSYNAWASGDDYSLNDIVESSESYYVCIQASGSGANAPADGVANTWWRPTAKLTARRIYDYTVDHEFPGRPGWARVIALYKRPTLHELSEEAADRAILYIHVGADAAHVVIDKDGNKIDMMDSTTTDTFVWKPIGDAIALEPKCNLRLHTAFSDLNVPTFMSLIGKVNNAVLTDFGNAAAGTLLFIGADTIYDPDNPDYQVGDLYFRYSVTPWNESLIARKMAVTVTEMPIKQLDGTDTGRKKNIIRLEEVLDGGSAVTEDAALYATGDFSDFNAMLTW